MSKAANGRCHHLIHAFAERTCVPMLLNSSSDNIEPLVCNPAEALNCFLRTHPIGPADP